MAADKISHMPCEVILLVMDDLDSSDLKHVSYLSAYFRSLATFKLFKHIILNRDVRCTRNNALETRIIPRYGHNVRTVSYVCQMYPDSASLVDELPYLNNILAGRLLEHVTDIRLVFPRRWDFSDFAFDINENLRYDQSDPVIDHRHKKRTLHWQSSVTRTFEALSENRRLRRFEIHDLVPLVFDIWTSMKWKALLRRLTTFKMSIRQASCYFGWRHTNAITSAGYRTFIEALQPSFFKYLISVNHLHLIADSENIPGCRGPMHVPLPISNDNLPLLQELVLENCCIDWALTRFLCHKRDHLRSIKLLGCFATEDATDTHDAISWESFFASIRESSPCRLTEFHLSEAKLRAAEFLGPELRAAQKESKKPYRLFGYGHRIATGYFMPSDTMALESLRDGRDRNEYDALMQLVEDNKMHLSQR